MLITSRKNELVRHFRDISRDKKLRDSEGIFAVEGEHLCMEALACGLCISAALVTESACRKYPETAEQLKTSAQTVVVISDDVAEYISDTKSPQGLFALVEKPVRSDVDGDKLVILDGVQDPGNVGTVIRTAEALGISGAYLSESCADIWSPKTLRASMGSVLRLPCITGPLADTITGLKNDGYSVYGAILDDEAQSLDVMRFPEKAAVVIGSEGRGISDEVRALCTGGLYIPISGAESLNAAAAAAIILWELAKG